MVSSKIFSSFLLINLFYLYSSSLFYPLNTKGVSQKLCAKYTCKVPTKEEKYCAFFNGTSGSQIELIPRCNTSEFCDIGGSDPNEVFYNHEKVNATCKPFPVEMISKRYPGEDCQTDSDCINIPEIKTITRCVNKKCVGIEKDKKCQTTEACLAGLYCDSQTGRCEKQKAEFEDCKSTYECENSLLCYQGQCQDVMFQIPTGTTINEKDVNLDYYCEFGLNIDGVCAKLTVEEKEIKEPRECNGQNLCEYTYEPSTLGKISLPCECGYNNEGLGYCPASHSYKTEAWKKYFLLQKLKYNNECHSYSRYNCYSNYGQLKELLSNAIEELRKGSRYEKGVECAKEVFKNLN